MNGVLFENEKKFRGCLYNNGIYTISFFGAGIILFVVHS